MSVTSLNGIQNAVTAVSLNSGISITTAGQELNFNALSGGVTSIIADGQSTAGDINLVGAGTTTITNDGNNTITITSTGSGTGGNMNATNLTGGGTATSALNWKPEDAYNPGDVVRDQYDGSTYVCIVAVSAPVSPAINPKPGTDTAHWTVFGRYNTVCSGLAGNNGNAFPPVSEDGYTLFGTVGVKVGAITTTADATTLAFTGSANDLTLGGNIQITGSSSGSSISNGTPPNSGSVSIDTTGNVSCNNSAAVGANQNFEAGNNFQVVAGNLVSMAGSSIELSDTVGGISMIPSFNGGLQIIQQNGASLIMEGGAGVMTINATDGTNTSQLSLGNLDGLGYSTLFGNQQMTVTSQTRADVSSPLIVLGPASGADCAIQLNGTVTVNGNPIGSGGSITPSLWSASDAYAVGAVVNTGSLSVPTGTFVCIQAVPASAGGTNPTPQNAPTFWTTIGTLPGATAASSISGGGGSVSIDGSGAVNLTSASGTLSGITSTSTGGNISLVSGDGSGAVTMTLGYLAGFSVTNALQTTISTFGGASLNLGLSGVVTLDAPSSITATSATGITLQLDASGASDDAFLRILPASSYTPNPTTDKGLVITSTGLYFNGVQITVP